MGRVIPLAILLLSFVVNLLQAQWQANGIPVCDTSANSGFYLLPQIASDGQGGAFVCWRDARNSSYGNNLGLDIYAQRIAADGTILWQKNGIPIVVAPYNQQYPRMIGDGKGGVFIAWEDDRSLANTEIFAQYINAQGQSAWQGGGLKGAESPGLFISLALDGHGGLLLAWNGPNINNVCAQRLDSSGARIWGDSGLVVSNRSGSVYPTDVAIVSDEQAGAIVVWSQGYQVLVQRIDSIGAIRWAADGVPLTDSLRNVHVTLTSDSRNGAVVGWANHDSLQYAQRIRANGQKMWGQDGISLGEGGGGVDRQTDDGDGGAYVGYWHFVQHIDSSGNKKWADQGTQFTNANADFSNTVQARNGSAGVWCFYSYNEGGLSTSLDIRGQYVDSEGNTHWGPNGKGIAVTSGIQDYSQATSNDNGTALIAWDDFRNGHCMSSEPFGHNSG